MDEYRDFSVKLTWVEGLVVVALSGDWDIFAKDTLHDALSSTGGKHDIVVDARDARFFDSSALNEFVTFYNRATERGKHFELLIGNSNIERVLQITGLNELLLPRPDRVAFLEEHVP